MPCWDTCSLRPQNINWQDWKYTSFVIFIRYSQSIRRHNVICRDKLVADVVENIGLKLQFLSWFSIHFVLHRSYRFSYQMDSMYQCVIMSCIDLYLIEEVYSAIFFFIHYVNTSGLKLNFEKVIPIQCIQRRPQQVSLRPHQCEVEFFCCDRWILRTMYNSNLAS